MPNSTVNLSSQSFPEEELLDISIATFEPMGDPESEVYNLRKTESHQISWHLATVMRESESWGSIRINPFDLSHSELMISGTIVESNGQTLKISIKVTDSTGQTWIDKQYSQTIDYDFQLSLPRDSVTSWFQSLYNQIANDVLLYRNNNLVREQLLSIREISNLRFAAQYFPEIEQTYLTENSEGIITLNRLPAQNDPLFEQINSMKIRNDSFLDAIQYRYNSYITRTNEPYSAFIRRSHVVTELVKTQINQAKENVDTVDLGFPRFGASEVPGVRLDKPSRISNNISERRQFNQAIVSVGINFEQEIEPITVEFDESNVELSGTVDELFQQWKDIMDEIFLSETDL